MPQGPAQWGTNVPAGGEIVPLFRVHVHVAAVHRDYARHVQLARRHNRRWAGWDSPVRVDHIGPVLSRLGDDGPVLRLHVVGHDHHPGEATQPADPALGDSAISEIRRQLQGEADDLYPVEHVGPGERSVPRGNYRDGVAPTNQMPVDVVDVGGLSVTGVLGIPVGGTDNTQRGFLPPKILRGHLRCCGHQSPCCHMAFISEDKPG